MSSSETPKQHEQFENEVFGLNTKIPLFKLQPAMIDPNGLINTFESQLTLKTEALPDLPFAISLGHPKGSHPTLGMFSENKRLHLEADVNPLIGIGLARRKPHKFGVYATFGYYEPFHYDFTKDTLNLIDRLRLRVFDGEDGKIYEAQPSVNELTDRGKVSFKAFFEIHLDEKNNVVLRGEQLTGLEYTLKSNTGAEDTQIEFILMPPKLDNKQSTG